MANSLEGTPFGNNIYNYTYGINQGEMFKPGDFYPPIRDKARIQRYRRNKLLFLGKHFEIMMNVNRKYQDLLYVSMNITSIICKKSADFLFSHSATIIPITNENEDVNEAYKRILENNHMDIINYESALSNAYRGDAFYKIRWGQSYNGELDEVIDPYRVIIENQNSDFVFPETYPNDINSIKAYHIGVPVSKDNKGIEWKLLVESHYPGKIVYKTMELSVIETTVWGVPMLYKVNAEVPGTRYEVETGVPVPLIVHVPNYSLDDSWEGIDDITELYPIQDEINNRLTQITSILDKHSDPAMAVPLGTLREDELGKPTFNVAQDKIFEYDGQKDAIPMYITYDGKLTDAFKELDLLVEKAFMLAEIPPLALGASDQGTSKASGSAIKLRMLSISSKIMRKEKYYRKGLREVMLAAQMLENVHGDYSYPVTPAQIMFTDAIPKDDLELAQIMQIRTGNKPTMTVAQALNVYDDRDQEKAEEMAEEIREESQQNLKDMQANVAKNGVPGAPKPVADDPGEVEAEQDDA